MKSALLSFTAFALLSTPAFADIKLENVHAFETSKGMKNGAVLMEIENTGDQTDKLISVSSPVATEVEIHEMKEENGVMKMREVGGIPLPAHKVVSLNPNGYHIMLLGLKEPLAAGKAFPLTLKFQRAGDVKTTAEVQTRAKQTIAPADHSGHMNHMDHPMDHTGH